MDSRQVFKFIGHHSETPDPDFGVKSLALLGSVARYDATASGDVDLLVKFDGPAVGFFRISSGL